MIARHSFAVVTLVMATTAYAQSDSAAIKQSVTFKAGDVGPYFCPTGWLRSARIVSGDPVPFSETPCPGTPDRLARRSRSYR